MRYQLLRKLNMSNKTRPPAMATSVAARRPDRRGFSAAGDLACLQARGADVQALFVAARAPHRAHGLNVRVPPTTGPAVRVRHRLAEAGALPADVADGSHNRNSIRIDQRMPRRWPANQDTGRGDDRQNGVGERWPAQSVPLR